MVPMVAHFSSEKPQAAEETGYQGGCLHRGLPHKTPTQKHTKVQVCTHQRVPTCKPRTCPDFSILTR